ECTIGTNLEQWRAYPSARWRGPDAAVPTGGHRLKCHRNLGNSQVGMTACGGGGIVVIVWEHVSFCVMVGVKSATSSRREAHGRAATAGRGAIFRRAAIRCKKSGERGDRGE